MNWNWKQRIFALICLPITALVVALGAVILYTMNALATKDEQHEETNGNEDSATR